MSGGGGPPKPPDTSPSGGEFLLKLLQKPPSLSSAIPVSSFSDYPSPNHHDPAVAAVGPSIPFPPWPAPEMRPFFVPYPNIHPHGPWPLPGALDLQHLHKSQSFPENSGGGGQRPGFLPPNFGHQPPPPRNGVSPDTTLIFGSLRCDLMGQKGLTFGRSGMESQLHGSESTKRSVARPTGPNRYFPDVNGINQPRAEVNSHGPNELNHPPHRRQNDSKQQSVPFRRSGGAEPRKGKEMGQWVGNGKGRGEHDMGNERMFMNRQSSKNNESHLPLTVQLDRPGLQQGSKLHSAPAADIEESSASVHSGEVMREKDMGREGDSLSEQLMGGLAVREKSVSKPRERALNGSRNMDARSDFSGVHQVRGHQIRNRRREIECRNDIERLTHSFLSTYESLKPAEEEKDKQKQLLASLEKLVVKEWPKAQLFLYGSCANSFGVSHSDIDVCLAIDEKDTSKGDILLKLADILQSDNLQNVQALTRARVPIVKLMDPVTGISCDICINNVLAVVNTKLLRDYAQIDARLRQLAFIVKHWAKLRGVNETYRGTLSSYAYVLMCIHFLQQRKPAILPCLQEMDATYMVTIDEIECAFFDNVESLRDFGAPNKESIAKLLWAFFDYWAFRHDYANDVISLRTGTIISKREKDWTRRIGNDRHLICIEDPFEISHDLGRVVDKYNIKILREEFERAAYILQHDPNPSITLFGPYVPVERGT